MVLEERYSVTSAAVETEATTMENLSKREDEEEGNQSLSPGGHYERLGDGFAVLHGDGMSVRESGAGYVEEVLKAHEEDGRVDSIKGGTWSQRE